MARSSRADGGRRLEAVHLRHLHVHEHHVEAFLRERVERRPAAADHRRHVAGLPEQAQHQLLVDHIVLGEQEAQRTAGDGRGARDRASGSPSRRRTRRRSDRTIAASRSPLRIGFVRNAAMRSSRSFVRRVRRPAVVSIMTRAARAPRCCRAWASAKPSMSGIPASISKRSNAVPGPSAGPTAASAASAAVHDRRGRSPSRAEARRGRRRSPGCRPRPGSVAP